MRGDPRHFPDLEELTGEAAFGSGGQTDEQMIHAVRMWRATLAGSTLQ